MIEYALIIQLQQYSSQQVNSTFFILNHPDPIPSLPFPSLFNSTQLNLPLYYLSIHLHIDKATT